jgi:hypothetical protein
MWVTGSRGIELFSPPPQPFDREGSIHEGFQEVVRIYLLRWRIEEYDLLLKSSCKAEERQIETAKQLMKMLAIVSANTMRIPQLPWSQRFKETLPAIWPGHQLCNGPFCGLVSWEDTPATRAMGGAGDTTSTYSCSGFSLLVFMAEYTHPTIATQTIKGMTRNRIASISAKRKKVNINARLMAPSPLMKKRIRCIMPSTQPGIATPITKIAI